MSIQIAPFAVQEITFHVAGSALPDAPVVHEPATVPTAPRTRTALAGLLHRAADVVAPANYRTAH